MAAKMEAVIYIVYVYIIPSILLHILNWFLYQHPRFIINKLICNVFIQKYK